MKTSRWGMGWSLSVGVGWFTKDPNTGATLPQATPYKLLKENGELKKSSLYYYWLNENGPDFTKGEANIYKLKESTTFAGGASFKKLNCFTNYTAGNITVTTPNGSIPYNAYDACVNC